VAVVMVVKATAAQSRLINLLQHLQMQHHLVQWMTIFRFNDFVN
jgi:hypothetical protein